MGIWAFVKNLTDEILGSTPPKQKHEKKEHQIKTCNIYKNIVKGLSSCTQVFFCAAARREPSLQFLGERGLAEIPQCSPHKSQQAFLSPTNVCRDKKTREEDFPKNHQIMTMILPTQRIHYYGQITR